MMNLQNFNKDTNGKIPAGWCWVTLGDICNTTSGGTPSRKMASYYGGNILWVKSGELNDSQIFSTEETITEEGIAYSSAKIFPAGTLLIALYGATVGKLAKLEVDAATNQAVCGIFRSEVVYRDFLFYYLLTQRPNLLTISFGGAQPNISQEIVRNIQIPLPPLREQACIVSKVDELLAGVNSARERLARVPGILKRFRQSVLAAACSGRLTAEWRDLKIKEGEQHDFIESDFQNLPDLPISWEWKKLETITDYLGGYAFKSKSFLRSGDNQVLRIGNVRPGYIDLNTAPVFINDIDANKFNRFELKLNDLLISMTGTKYKRDYGFVGLISFITDKRLFLNQRVGRLRCKGDCMPKYLYYYLQTEFFRNFFFVGETGNVNQGNVGAPALKNTLIASPLWDEQQEIVRRVEALFQLAGAIEARVAAGAHRADRLTQAILAKAFRGELVPTEAELARREGRDFEPAAGLLSRLKEERRLITEAQPRRQTLKGQKQKTTGT